MSVEESMEKVIRRDGRYPLEAFSFLHEGFNYAVRKVYGKRAKLGGTNHVTGPQLCQALQDLALKKWGLMAKAVLARWNIHGTIDFGQMVFLLVDHSFMKKTEEDNLDHFRDVYDFDELAKGLVDFDLKE